MTTSPSRSTPTPPTRSTTPTTSPQLDAFDLLLIEQPLADRRPAPPRRAGAADAHADLPRRVDHVGHAAADAIALGACSIVNIKAGRVGGYLEAVRVHDVCLVHGVPVVVRRDARDRARPGRQRGARRPARASPCPATRRRRTATGPRPHRAVRARPTATSPCRAVPGSESNPSRTCSPRSRRRRPGCLPAAPTGDTRRRPVRSRRHAVGVRARHRRLAGDGARHGRRGRAGPGGAAPGHRSAVRHRAGRHRRPGRARAGRDRRVPRRLRGERTVRDPPLRRRAGDARRAAGVRGDPRRRHVEAADHRRARARPPRPRRPLHGRGRCHLRRHPPHEGRRDRPRPRAPRRRGRPRRRDDR